MRSDKDFIVDKMSQELRELFKLAREVEDLTLRIKIGELIVRLQERLLFIEKVL